MAKKRAELDPVVMELTPMIDVVFLLLIFFIVTLKFKVLEGKLPTFLPKDVGVNSVPVDVLMLKLEIQITSAGTTEGLKGEQFSMTVGVDGRRVASLRTVLDQLKGMKLQDPELKVTLYPGQGVDYEEVVKVVDVCVEAKITDITFAGVAFDA